MFRRHLSVLLLVLTVLLDGCTVDISQQAFGTPPVQSLSGQTEVNPASNLNPPAYTTRPVLPTMTIPVTWSDLKLSGRLVYLVGFQEDNNPHVMLQSLDLVSGVVTTLYQTPPIWWISAAVVSPDEKEVVLSYATPTNFPAIYWMPLDGSSAPHLLFAPPTKDDEYIEPVWSPDGKYIYFAHTNFSSPPKKANQLFPVFDVERIAYPNGVPEKLVTDAYWPRLAPDGSRLVYVSENPDDKTDRLFISAPDGSDPQRVELKGPGVPTIIDAPLFLPDGKTILFSGFVKAQSFTPNWLDWLLGVQVASAHSLPEDWWSVPVAGGGATQLTHIQAPSLYASLSPDGRLLASFSGNGVFVMGLDGSGLTMIVNDVGGIPGTVNWIP
jgi:Tol biopolymer transport system component